MKTLKIMAITGMVLFSLFFLMAVVPQDKDKAPDRDALTGALVVVGLYGLALSIVAFIQAKKVMGPGQEGTGEQERPPPIPVLAGNERAPRALSPTNSKTVGVQPFDEELRKWADLKRDGIVSEEEFNQKKKSLLGL